jgi:hypothetical protein
VLEGAEANERPDLARRLSKAAGAITATAMRQADLAPLASLAVQSLQSLEIDLRTRRAALLDPARRARLVAEMRHAEARSRQYQERSAQ